MANANIDARYAGSLRIKIAYVFQVIFHFISGALLNRLTVLKSIILIFRKV